MDKDSIDIKQVSFFDIDVEENKTNCFHSPIDESIDEAEKELQEIQLKIEETEQSLNSLTPKSDNIAFPFGGAQYSMFAKDKIIPLIKKTHHKKHEQEQN